MENVYILDACRTPFGKINGVLASVRPDDLAARVIGALVKRNPYLVDIPPDDVVWGAANQAGEDNRNVARMAGLLAGLGPDVPGVTVNRLCGSGMQAVADAAARIRSEEADIVVAGGSEAMTRAPFVTSRPDRPFPRDLHTADTRLGWRLVNPAMAEMYGTTALGETAEIVAERYGVTRQDQDRLALRSHTRAAAAAAGGLLDDEIIPIEVGDERVAVDESIKANLRAEDLAAARPAFRPAGTVTARNASPLNDGAAGLVVASGRLTRRLGVEPLARYVGSTVVGVHPDVMGIGPVPATRKLLDRVGWAVGDIDVFELNEAFAAQAVACVRELGIGEDQLNPRGGAIAIGHPLGASGARLVGSTARQLAAGGGRRGVATMCIGVGQGIAVALERS